MQAALDAGAARHLFAIIDHPDGMVYLWSGTGEIEWDGNTYLGRGALGGWGQVQSGSTLQISDRTLTLRGIDPEQTQFLSANVRNRIAQLYLGCVVDGVVVPDPYLIEEVDMDSQSLPIDERGRMSVQITAYAGLTTLQRAQNKAWSSEEAKSVYPDEIGFDLIPQLQNKETKWTLT